jgi:hypothetical protein
MAKEKHTKSDFGNSSGRISLSEFSTYLNGIQSVCVYRNIIFSISFEKGELILLFCGAILDSYRENLEALGGESCSSCRSRELTGSGLAVDALLFE